MIRQNVLTNVRDVLGNLPKKRKVNEKKRAAANTKKNAKKLKKEV